MRHTLHIIATAMRGGFQRAFQTAVGNTRTFNCKSLTLFTVHRLLEFRIIPATFSSLARECLYRYITVNIYLRELTIEIHLCVVVVLIWPLRIHVHIHVHARQDARKQTALR